MRSYRESAIVLRTHKLGEADRIITLLTQNSGKVRATAKGIRKTTSKFGARLEPMTQVEVQLIEGRNLDIVTQAQTLHPLGARLSRDYSLWTSGQAMVETVDRLISETGQPSRQHYRLLSGALAALLQGTIDGTRPHTMILDSYLLRAMATSGYAPNLTDCGQCAEPGPHRAFSPAAGGVVCHRCRPLGAAMPRSQTIDYLKMLLAGDWAATRAIDPTHQAEASTIVAAFVNWHLERSIRSLREVDRSFPDQAVGQ